MSSEQMAMHAKRSVVLWFYRFKIAQYTIISVLYTMVCSIITITKVVTFITTIFNYHYQLDQFGTGVVTQKT